MSKFIKRKKHAHFSDPEEGEEEEEEEEQGDEKVTDVGEAPPEPKTKEGYKKDLGILSFKDRKIYVGKKFVSFDNDSIYKASTS